MRVENTMKNASILLLGQIVGLLVSFASRTLFLWVLNAEYLGVNGLFTDVLSILSLAEMGFGPAIIYTLYKPLAVGDEQKVKELMSFYATAYKTIGLSVLTLGLAVMPFLDFIIRDATTVENINLIYILFLLNSVVSYFYTYKRSLIIANQKEYIVSLYSRLFFILMTIVQILVLFATENFILYLVIRVLFTFTENLWLSKKADKMYPFLQGKNREKLGAVEKKSLFKNVRAMVAHRVGAAVIQGTDNILISTFVGIRWVGLYSNYSLIIIGLTSLINPLLGSVTASVGNLNAVEDEGKSFSVFKTMFLVNFWLYGFSTIALWILFEPFITLWIGTDYLLGGLISSVIALNFFISGMRKTTLVFRDSAGLFYNDRFKPVAEGLINLIASIILARLYGMIGVLFGTMISTLTTAFWVEPYIVYKHIFKRSSSDYFVRYITYTLLMVGAALVTRFSIAFLSTENFESFVIKVILCTIIPNCLFYMAFRKTAEFIYLKEIVSQLIKKVHNRKKTAIYPNK